MKKRKRREVVSHGRLQNQVDNIKRLDHRIRSVESVHRQGRVEHNYRQRLFVMEKMKAIFKLELRPEIDFGGGETYKPAFVYELAKSGGVRVIGDFLARHPDKAKRDELSEKVKSLYGVGITFVS